VNVLREIVALTRQGLSPTEIAARLGYSEKWVGMCMGASGFALLMAQGTSEA
jgi:transposase